MGQLFPSFNAISDATFFLVLLLFFYLFLLKAREAVVVTYMVPYTILSLVLNPLGSFFFFFFFFFCVCVCVCVCVCLLSFGKDCSSMRHKCGCWKHSRNWQTSPSSTSLMMTFLFCLWITLKMLHWEESWCPFLTGDFDDEKLDGVSLDGVVSKRCVMSEVHLCFLWEMVQHCWCVLMLQIVNNNLTAFA